MGSPSQTKGLGEWQVKSLAPSQIQRMRMGLRIIEGQGQPPFTKSASAVLGIYGNGQTMENVTWVMFQGSNFPQDFCLGPELCLVMERRLVKVSFVTHPQYYLL